MTSAEIFVGISAAALETTENVVYLLDRELRILYCNPAWDRFAMANGASAAWLRDRAVGQKLQAVIPAPLERFYADVFDAAQRAAVTFDYECNSPDLFRSFRMQVMQRENRFLVANALRVEQPMAEAGRVAYTPAQFRYQRSDGLITMCCHCRKTRRLTAENTWDWVPNHLRRPPLTVSHGICPICVDHHYRHDLAAAARV